jgi:WXG100 family type VII secretion target
MAQNISVNYESLNQSAAQLRSGRDELDQILSNLRSQVKTLTTGGFKTVTASGRFDAFNQEWTQSTNQMMLALDEISRAMSDSASRHQQTDSSLAEGVGGLGSTGGGGSAV